VLEVNTKTQQHWSSAEKKVTGLELTTHYGKKANLYLFLVLGLLFIILPHVCVTEFCIGDWNY
jgi:hypothetical protein